MKAANMDKAEQASRSKPPPPVPSQASHPAVTTVDQDSDYADYGRIYTAYKASQAAAGPDKRVVTFSPNVTKILAEMKKREEQKKTLINDKPTMRQLSNTYKSRPNVYASPYAHGYGSAGGATVKEGTTTYGNGLLSKVVEGDEENDLDGEEWVDVKEARGKEAEEATVESEYVRVEIDRKEQKAGIRGHASVQHRRPTAAAAARGVGGPAGGLADSYYSACLADEKKKIDEESKKMGWYLSPEN